MSELRKGLPPLPARMVHLAISEKGYPIPFFVATFNGKPDFRIVDPMKMYQCVKFNRCWICGNTLGVHRTFVVGPLGALNRINSEPPAHLECAQFAMQACPHILHPEAQHRDAALPDGAVLNEAAFQLSHNPGVYGAWITGSYEVVQHPQTGTVLFLMGEPQRIEWYAEGRAATYDEVEHSVYAGIMLTLSETGTPDDEQKETLAQRLVMLRRYFPAPSMTGAPMKGGA